MRALELAVGQTHGIVRPQPGGRRACHEGIGRQQAGPGPAGRRPGCRIGRRGRAGHDELDTLGGLGRVRGGDCNLDGIGTSGTGEGGPGKGQSVGAGPADICCVGGVAHIPAVGGGVTNGSGRDVFRVQRDSVGGEIIHRNVGTEHEPIVLIHDVHGYAVANKRAPAASRGAEWTGGWGSRQSAALDYGPR